MPDLIEPMFRIMNKGSYFTGLVNIGNPVEFKMIELAELVLRLTGSKSKLILKPLPEDDSKQQKSNIQIAIIKLDCIPKVSLSDGLLETVYFFQRNLVTKVLALNWAGKQQTNQKNKTEQETYASHSTTKLPAIL